MTTHCEAPITKLAVAAAMREIEEADNDYPSVPKIRAKLKKLFGHSGHNNEIHKWQREIKAERMLQLPEQPSSGATDLLPKKVEEIFPHLKRALAQAFAEAKEDIHREAAVLVARAREEVDRYTEESRKEISDILHESERLEVELEATSAKLADVTASLSDAKEKLAAANDRIASLISERDSVKDEIKAERAKNVELIAETGVITGKLLAATDAAAATEQELERLKVQLAQLVAERDSLKLNHLSENTRADEIVADRDAAKQDATTERNRQRFQR